MRGQTLYNDGIHDFGVETSSAKLDSPRTQRRKRHTAKKVAKRKRRSTMRMRGLSNDFAQLGRERPSLKHVHSVHGKLVTRLAVKALLKGSSPQSLGIERIMTKTEGDRCRVWVSECYCTRTDTFEVKGSKAVLMSSSGDDATKTGPEGLPVRSAMKSGWTTYEF
jgi:hypothetical protein